MLKIFGTSKEIISCDVMYWFYWAFLESFHSSDNNQEFNMVKTKRNLLED